MNDFDICNKCNLLKDVCEDCYEAYCHNCNDECPHCQKERSFYNRHDKKDYKKKVVKIKKDRTCSKCRGTLKKGTKCLTFATNTERKWIHFKCKTNEKKEQKIKELSEKELQILDIIFKDFSAKELVKELAYNDYIDFHEIRDYYFNELCTDDLIKERVIDDF